MSQETTNLIHKDTGDGTILIWPWAYSAVVAGTWTWTASSSYSYNGYWINTSNALNDQLDYRVWLSKGIWIFALQCIWTTSGPRLGVYIDDVLTTSIDTYNGGTGQTIEVAAPYDLLITTTGLKKMSVKVIGRHPSCGYYYAYMSHIILRRMN
jgi:hypothetical protein